MRRTGREMHAVMQERTIPTSLAFATLAKHLSSPEKYVQVVHDSQEVLKKLVSKVAATSTSTNPVQLVVCDLSSFSYTTVGLFADGCFDGQVLWSWGSE